MFWHNTDWNTSASIVIILAGAVLLLIGILKQKHLFAAVPFIRENNRQLINHSLEIGRLLTILFLGSYLVVAYAFAENLAIIGKLFVSLVFFGGAVFVLLGITLNARILAEIQTTLQGLLPICMNCKKIRPAGADPGDQQSWTEIETFISRHSDAVFSHGLCPDCLAKMRRKNNKQ